MTTPSRDPEPAGGADGVPKTTYVVGQGTEPEAPSPDREARANGARVAWVIVAVLIIAVAAYALLR